MSILSLQETNRLNKLNRNVMQKALAQMHPLSVIPCHIHYEILVRKVSMLTHRTASQRS